MAHNLYMFIPLLIRAALVGALIAYCIYRGNHPVKRSETEKKVLRVAGFAALGVLGIMGAFLFRGLWDFSARGRINSSNSSAKLVCEACKCAVIDLDERDMLPEHSAEIIYGQPGEEHEKDSFGYFMDYYFSDHPYYVIVTDGNWHVQYTLVSNKPITPEKIHPYSYDSQRKLMTSLFRDHKELVGYYKPPEPKEETT